MVISLRLRAMQSTTQMVDVLLQTSIGCCDELVQGHNPKTARIYTERIAGMGRSLQIHTVDQLLLFYKNALHRSWLTFV